MLWFDRIQSLDKDTLERIKKSMEHGNLHVKIYVIRAILRLEPDDAAVNLAFQVILKEKDWYTMGKAAEILNRLPKLSVETLQVLREVLLGKNGGWSSQLQLAEALLRFQPSNLEAMQLIQGHLRDKYYNSDASWYCRLKAASALLHIQVFDAKAIQILQHDLRSRSKIDERISRFGKD